MTRLPPWLALCCMTLFQCSCSTVFGLKCKPNSSFPHPLDCGSFYLCGDDMERHHFECPQGLLYHEEKKACDWAANVRCNLTERLETLKEDIRVLELVKKYGFDIPINSTEDETSDSPILTAILDLEEKCVNMKENKTIEDVDKPQKEYVSECGETLMPYLHDALEELDEKYNITELLENGKSKYLVKLMEHNSSYGTEYNKQSSVGEEKDGLIETERDGNKVEGGQKRENEQKIDGLHKGEGQDKDEQTEEKEQIVKDKNGNYKEQKVDDLQNDSDLHKKMDDYKFNLNSNNKTLEKRKTAENQTTKDILSPKLFHRTMLIIDSEDVNKSDNESSIIDTVPLGGKDNSTGKENNTKSIVKTLEYQPHFPLLNSGKIQLHTLGYEEAKISCNNETCSDDDHEHVDQQDKVDREPIFEEDRPQERNTTQTEETKDEKYSPDEKSNQQTKPRGTNTTETEESKDEKQSDLEEENDQQASLKDLPQESSTTQTEEITDGKHLLSQDLEDANDQRTTLKEIPAEEHNTQTEYTLIDENTEKTSKKVPK